MTVRNRVSFEGLAWTFMLSLAALVALLSISAAASAVPVRTDNLTSTFRFHVPLSCPKPCPPTGCLPLYARTIKSSDEVQIKKFDDVPGASVRYEEPVNKDSESDFTKWQARAAYAFLNKAVVDKDIGSRAYQVHNKELVYPPGWDTIEDDLRDTYENESKPPRPHRGHLLADSLGGSGHDARNIVAMYPRTNCPYMYKWEKLVKDIVQTRLAEKDLIFYAVEARYDSVFPSHPTHIVMYTYYQQWNSFIGEYDARPWFTVSIPNDRVLLDESQTMVLRDHTQELFP